MLDIKYKMSPAVNKLGYLITQGQDSIWQIPLRTAQLIIIYNPLQKRVGQG